MLKIGTSVRHTLQEVPKKSIPKSIQWLRMLPSPVGFFTCAIQAALNRAAPLVMHVVCEAGTF